MLREALRWQNVALAVLVLATLVVGAVAWRAPMQTPTDGLSGTMTAASPTASTAAPTTATSVSPSPTSSPSTTGVPVPDGAIVAFLGDSLAAGSGASKFAYRWTTLLSTPHHWVEVNLAHPQTGYTRAGQAGECTPEICRAFPDLVDDVVRQAPALVIITGGANDLATTDQEAVRTAVTQTVDALHSALPDVQVAVVNPWWDRRPEDANLPAYSDVIRSAATDAGAIWLETGQPVTDPALLQADGLTPNDAGHAALAKAVQDALAQAGLVASAP